MNLFSFRYESSKELEPFPHIREVAFQRNTTVQLNSFPTSVSNALRIYYILDGKFDWVINGEQHTLYPGDIVLILPGSEIGGVNGVLELGTIVHLFIQLEENHDNTDIVLGEWSGLTGGERCAVTRALMFNDIHVLKIKEAELILYELGSEILRHEIGHVAQVNHLIDTLLILIARHSSRHSAKEADISDTFAKLEETLRAKPSHQWTVEEMATLLGLGTTAFTEKVKTHTGFSPLNYLINIRISEAIKLLQEPGANFTDIALATGFYSSQHFSTTFKKFTGYTPGGFRKKHALDVSGRLSASVLAG